MAVSADIYLWQTPDSNSVQGLIGSATVRTLTVPSLPVRNALHNHSLRFSHIYPRWAVMSYEDWAGSRGRTSVDEKQEILRLAGEIRRGIPQTVNRCLLHGHHETFSGQDLAMLADDVHPKFLQLMKEGRVNHVRMWKNMKVF